MRYAYHLLPCLLAGLSVAAHAQTSYVGIGTNTPAAPLHVLKSGTTGTSETLRLESGHGAGSGLRLLSTAAGGRSFSLLSTANDASAGAGKLGFYDETAAAYRLVLDATGNLGLGTTAPAAKLDVVGRLRIADGTQSAGRVLTSDASGLTSWQTPSVSVTGSNGLNASGSIVGLGGTLAQATTVNVAPGTSFALAAPGAGVTDQNSPTDGANAAAGLGENLWQSFTAGRSGLLTGFQLQIGGNSSGGCTVAYTLYAGEGTGGAVLSPAQTVTIPNFLNGAYTFPLAVPITAGQQYTIAFTQTVGSTYAVTIRRTVGMYAGGRLSGYPSDQDLAFITTVADYQSALQLNSNGNVGIGTTAPAYKLDVNGVVRASNVSVTSDQRLKQHIRPLTGALPAVLGLRGTRYDFRRAEFPQRNLPAGEQIGFIAQEVESLFPELVNTDAQGFKSVNYAQLTPVLVEAIKEQQRQIEQLKTEVADGQARLQQRQAQFTASTTSLETRLKALENLLGARARAN